MGNLQPFDQLDDKGQRKLTALEVAQIAAVLVNGGKSVVESVGLALELLDASQWGLQYLNPEGYRKGYEYGARLWEDAQACRAEIKEYEAKIPKPKWEKEKSGEFSPLPFNEAMALLFPRLKTTDRMPRFRQWLASYYQRSNMEAGEEIGKLRQTGISKQLFETCAFFLPHWWDKQLAQMRSTAAKQRVNGRKSTKRGKNSASP